MQKNSRHPIQQPSGALGSRMNIIGGPDKKPFYAMKRPAKPVNVDEPRYTSNNHGIVQLANTVPDERGDVSTEKIKIKARDQATSSSKIDLGKNGVTFGSISRDKSLKRFLSRKDVSSDTNELQRPKPKKTPDKNFNLFPAKPSSAKHETPDPQLRKPAREKPQPEKSKTPIKLASNEKPQKWIPRPHPYHEVQLICAPAQPTGFTKKPDDSDLFQHKPFMHGIFHVLSKSKERRNDSEMPSKDLNHSPNQAKPVPATIKSALKKKDRVYTPKDISESVDNPKEVSNLDSVSQMTPSSKGEKPVQVSSLRNVRGPSFDKGRSLGKSISKKKISISPSPNKESQFKPVKKSNSNNSLTRKSMSPDQLSKKVRERSEIAQNSFKMNLQDLINIDEIFVTIVYKPNQNQLINNFDLLRHFIVNNYCFVLKDLNLLFYNQKFREVMRMNYLKELLYFVFMYVILFQNHLEFLAIQKKMGSSSMSAMPKNGKGGDRMSIRGYISSINRETEELILQVLSYIHIVFILRTEIFMDRAAVYYQNHKTYRELQMLLSKRKSKYSINALKKDNYDHFVQKMNRYLDLCEQALHELFKLNPSFREISGILANALNYITVRTGELTIKDCNIIFSQFKIAFDSKGLAEFDLAPVLSLLQHNNYASEEDKIHDLEVPTVPFLKNSRPPNKLLTLVIDLDETLIHYPDEHLEDLEKKVELENFKIRPFCFEFLQQLSLYYELVIFTAASQNYADLIIDHIDSKSLISHRLYRQHLSVHNNKLIKDLTKMGRDLKSVIILDNMPENFTLQPDNGIYIKSWRGDENDKCLAWLLPVFVNIANMRPDDVRDVMQELKKLLVETIK